MKKILKFIGYTVLLLIAAFALFLGYMSLTNYSPPPRETVELQSDGSLQTVPDTFNIVSWNVGYSGLGKEQDFFFDGGKNVRPSKALFDTYLSGIKQTLTGFVNAEFILLQEVDRNSKRSYYTDEADVFAQVLPGFSWGFAINYNSKFVPQPVTEPYGKTFGGLQSFAKIKPTQATRFALAEDASWPTGLFMLDRCYMEFRYPYKGKELLVINTHMSAYDDGTVKQRQMDTLKAHLLDEYAKGNYIVVGGDWNQFPPGYNPKMEKNSIIAMNVDESYPAEGWKWVYDLNQTTNRNLDAPYQKGVTEEVVIDFFLLSPNLQSIEMKGMDKGFEFSDHQPVYIKLAGQ